MDRIILILVTPHVKLFSIILIPGIINLPRKKLQRVQKELCYSTPDKSWFMAIVSESKTLHVLIYL